MTRAIAVLGAGAVGCYVGGVLAMARHDVTLIGRRRTIGPIEAHGLTIERRTGIVHHVQPRTCLDIDAAAGSRFDLLVLTVRAYDVAAALPRADVLTANRGKVITLQNGVGTDDLVVGRFGVDRVVAGTLTVSVGLDRPAVVTQYNGGGGIAASPYAGEPLDTWIYDTLASTGLVVRRIARPDSLKWSKLLLNALGSAQSAVLDIDLSTLAANPQLFRVEQLAFRETLAVMRAAQIPVVDLPGYRVRLAKAVMQLPAAAAHALLGRSLARGRGGRSPTMRTDADRGDGRTESTYLNGAVAARGAQLGVPTPVNAGLHELVCALAADTAARCAFHGRADKLLRFLRDAGAKV